MNPSLTGCWLRITPEVGWKPEKAQVLNTSHKAYPIMNLAPAFVRPFDSTAVEHSNTIRLNIVFPWDTPQPEHWCAPIPLKQSSFIRLFQKGRFGAMCRPANALVCLRYSLSRKPATLASTSNPPDVSARTQLEIMLSKSTLLTGFPAHIRKDRVSGCAKVSGSSSSPVHSVPSRTAWSRNEERYLNINIILGFIQFYQNKQTGHSEP